MLKIAICGGSGYTGIELLRILAGHPDARVTAITSEKSAGKRLTALFPHLHKYQDLLFEPLNKEKLLDKADIFFLALPHGASQEAVNFFFRNGKKVIDLSADFRLRDPGTYKDWYGLAHDFVPTLKRTVYGLPEMYRNRIRKARLIANPGCYPTSAILGLLPAIKGGLVDLSSIVIDSKSGTSGAGRKADIAVSFCEVNEGFKAYGIGTHRHTPEIEQELSFLAGENITVDFTPHLLPLDRGILTTIYAKLTKKTDTVSVLNVYKKKYGNEPFVKVLEEGVYPNIKNVRGTNFCQLGVKVNTRTNTLVIVSAIDNLVKGASGQAVHNMNIMTGIEEEKGLTNLALFP
ncbi:N-acetyl-gamma-glutamyl-phosphate reductase [Candidatus Sulfobium mesophilum]|uniref:N-acetyl-gamma-glutamyl-phosphate reductase n=1 Tax=Candidatus Sulfobium mesophilum TaxID=2016548 RepID=A0A2U3QFU2_9BACT|nr:N-acetyl-gamma-glutamyl-phosphate reductase [Candidatus Sulfobium mesophilum]